MDPLSILQGIGSQVEDSFKRNRHVLSFAAWFELFCSQPRIHARSAPQYLADAIDYYGHQRIKSATGTTIRYNLFDCPWDEGRDKVVGQESVQNALVRAIRSSARNGRVTQLIMLHGPNGSAKSSIVACLQRALEHYSTLPEGALYTFGWVFPTAKVSKKRLGFGDTTDTKPVIDSYAFLDDEDIDARLPADLCDHPLLLIPKTHRTEVIQKALDSGLNEENFRVSDYLLHGDLSPRSKKIFDTLLNVYHGDLPSVLRHVQVERITVSRRYRRAAVTVEPQLHVDAAVRQVTSDRSIGNLPAALQNLSLYEPYGDLVDANRGIIEFNDLLEKPMESYKYLLATCEKSSVALPYSILYLDVVFLATSNELHLNAFKEHHAFASFKGRIELIRAPYLLNYRHEQEVYDQQLRYTAISKKVAPHTTWIAALWAVLTRMKRPDPDRYPPSLKAVIANLSPLDKAELYTTGEAPLALPLEQSKELRAVLPTMLAEGSSPLDYEGGLGASPREMKTVLLNATQNERFATLSPLAVLHELENLVADVSVYEFLKVKPDGPYHACREFIDVVRKKYLDRVDAEFLDALGLVSENQYRDLFNRYVTHARYSVKGEKIVNPVTGAIEDPDELFMTQMEQDFNISKASKVFRQEIISRIGAWALDHHGETIRYEELFSNLFESLREAYFERHKEAVQRARSEILRYYADGPSSLEPRQLAKVETTLKMMYSRYGYDPESCRDALVFLLQTLY